MAGVRFRAATRGNMRSSALHALLGNMASKGGHHFAGRLVRIMVR